MPTAEQTIVNYNKAKEVHQLWQGIYDDAYNLYMPERNLYTETSEGEDRTTKIYTSAGITAANSFVNRMQQGLTPPEKKWMILKAGPAVPDEMKDEVNEALDKITDIFFNAIRSSNFNLAISEFFYDLFIGTACLLITEGKGNSPVDFKSEPNKNIAIEEGINGSVQTIYRLFKLKSELVKRMWPLANYTPKTDDEKKKVEILECTQYNYDADKWEYFVIDKTEKEIIYKSVFEISPWVVTRWSKMSNEVFGRGPALQALPETKMLNKQKEFSIQGMALSSVGVFTVADNNVLDYSKFRIYPGALNPVERNAGPNGPSIQRLDTGGNPNLEQYHMQETEMTIKKLAFDTQLPPQAGQPKSATEIMERVRELQIDIGGAFGRIMYEMIKPIVIRTLHILWKKGLIPPDLNVKNIDDFFIKVDMLSPIAKQQSLEDIQNITNAMQLSAMINPQGMAITYDIEAIDAELGDKLGVPAKFIRDKEDREVLKQQMQQSMEAERNKQMSAEAGKEIMVNEAKK
jgi:hypothetical protein